MALFKRKATWWVRFTAPDGARIRRSTGTEDRVKAQEYHDELKASLWRVHHLGERPRRTWQEAVVKWLNETAHKKTHEEDIAKLRWLDGFLRGRHLDEISREVIEQVAQAKEAEGVQPATVNRHLALIRAILRRASQEWGWIDQVPKVRVRSEPKRRVRFLTHEEAAALIAELPEHLAELARFSVATGLRMSNVVGLRWSQVDMERAAAWIHPDQAKAGKAIAVPLNDLAQAVVRRQQGRSPEWVFTYRGRQLRQCSTKAWYRALRRVGVRDFRWHDWRHTWASWHAQSGTPLSVLQELGGWASTEMVQRYAHLGSAHLASYAKNVLPNGTNLAHDDESQEV